MKPGVFSAKVLYHMTKAFENLKYAIHYRSIMLSGAFASNLLAWVAYSTCSEEVTASVHFRGSAAFLTFLADKYETLTPEQQELFQTYGPFVLDCANAWASRQGGTPHRLTTFSQRINYFEQLRRNDQTDSWYAGILEAANSTLGNLMEVALTWGYKITMREAEFDLSKENVTEVLDYIRSELGDAEFYRSLKTLFEGLQRAETDPSTVEGQLTIRLFHRLRSILLLLTLLETDSVRFGVLTPKANFIATSAIRFCRSQAIRRGGPIEDYYVTSWHNFSHLLIGGIALPVKDCPECNLILRPRDCANTTVCKWVVAELEFIGKEECSRILQRYWEERKIEDLVQILKFAQFPEPWPAS